MANQQKLILTKKFSNISVRLINEQRILQQLYWHGPQTQLSLRNELKLSSPTITQALQAFKEQDLVIEGEEMESSGGRKPRTVAFNRDAFHSVGVEIRKHYISIVVIDMMGKILRERTIRLPFENTPAYWCTMNRTIHELVDAEPALPRILGVGIAFPGELTWDGSSIERAVVLGLRNEPLGNIRQYFDFDIQIENAANTAGFGAVWRTHGIQDAVYIIVTDNGVAGSLIVDSHIFQGTSAHRKVGAFGHMVLVPDGKPCFCGGRGCWSAYCALSNLFARSDDDLDQFFTRVREGDPLYAQQWDSYLDYFAQAVGNIRLALDMDIIIGGKIAHYLKEYLPVLEQKVVSHPSLQGDGGFLKIDDISGNSLAIGAALIFVDRMLSGKLPRFPLP